MPPNNPDCSLDELKERTTTLESDLRAFKELMEERDKRYAQRSTAQDTAVAAALSTSKEAVIKAENATERRLETLNELRGVVVDQARDFARKSEVTLLVTGLEKRIDVITGLVKTQEGHGGGIKDVLVWLIGLGGLVIAALAVYLKR